MPNRNLSDMGTGIDFGQIAQTALGIGNLLETRHRNDLYQQNIERQGGQFQQQLEFNHKKLLLDQQQEQRQASQFKTQAELAQQRLEIDRQNQVQEEQKMRIDASKTAFTELQKMKESPALALNRQAQIEMTYQQANIMKQGLGMNVPMPSKEEMLGGYEEVDGLLKAMHDPSVPSDQKAALFDRALVSAPGWAKGVLDDMKRSNELSTQMEQKQLMLEANRTKLEKMNLEMGRYKLRENELTEHVGGVGRALAIMDDPRYKQQFARVMSYEKPEARMAYLNKLDPGFKEAIDRELATDRANVAQMNLFLSTDVSAKHRAMADYQAKHNGEAPADKVEELAVYGIIQKARLAEAAWLDDPFNKQKWADAKKGYEALKIQSQVVGSQVQKVSDDRMKVVAEGRLDETKRVNKMKEDSDIATQRTQQYFLQELKAGHSDNDAGLRALARIQKEMPGVPVDPGKIKNLEKSGRLDVNIAKMGQEDVTRNLRMIEGGQSVLDYTGEIIDRIKQNPGIIGKGAQLGTAFAGAAQQLRAIAAEDPGAAKFLNTNIRDNVEAMHEILVYQVAKTMDPSGALDIKVVEHARESVGDISAWSTGPQQVLNKLEQARTNAERSIRKSRRRIRMGIQGYLENEAPPEGGPAKDVKDMTEQELLQTILGERLQ